MLKPDSYIYRPIWSPSFIYSPLISKLMETEMVMKLFTFPLFTTSFVLDSFHFQFSTFLF